MQDTGFSLYKQLIERIKYYLLSGNLEIQQKLAPPKALAERLGINKNTIITAYKQLESEGLLMTKNGQGTYVSDVPELWKNQQAAKELVDLAKKSQETALKLGFTLDDWFMVVFNQTILDKTIPDGSIFNWEAVGKEELTHMLFVTDSTEPAEKIAREVGSAFVFHLPVRVCSLDELEQKLSTNLVVNAYAVYTLVHLAQPVEEIIKPTKKNVIVLPYWMKRDYPWS